MCDEAQCPGGKGEREGGLEDCTEGSRDSVSLPRCSLEAFVALVFLWMSYRKVPCSWLFFFF